MITTIAPGAPASLRFFTQRSRAASRSAARNGFELGRQWRLGTSRSAVDGEANSMRHEWRNSRFSPSGPRRAAPVA